MAGALTERLKFGTVGVLDFACGLVVHLNAGIAGLIYALILGRRRGELAGYATLSISASAAVAALAWNTALHGERVQ